MVKDITSGLLLRKYLINLGSTFVLPYFLLVFMILEELKKEIFSISQPPQWRKGQFVFNYIDQIYGVARDVQFKDNVDCFYNDDKIDEFLECVIKRLN